MHLLDLRRFRPRWSDDWLMIWLFIGAMLLGLLVVVIVGHPLDVAP